MPRVAVALLAAVLIAASLAVAAPSANAETQTAIALGAWVPGAPDGMSPLQAHVADVGRSPAMLMWYQDWTGPLVNTGELNAVTERGAVPMITWEAWDHHGGTRQPAYALRNIVGGDFDAYLRTSAAAAAAWGKPLFIRVGHEMNGTWYPWGRDVNGNTPAAFVAAWRHIVTLFRQQGATNVRWVWSPNVDYGGAEFVPYYPGDAWVDWAALDGYNWGALHGPRGWQSLTSIFAPSYDVLARLTRRPLMIAETASNDAGGDKAAWIRSAFLSELPSRMPRMRAVVWFDQDKEADWRVQSSPETLTAFRSVAATPLYSAPGSQLVATASVQSRLARASARRGAGR
jgi:hypothetical protein